MFKVVLDTNQFVSSLLVKLGPPAQLLQAWRDRRFILMISPPIMGEIKKVLQEPRIRKKYHISHRDIRDLLALLEQDALMVKGQLSVSVIREDPSDNAVLACAIEGGADYIVSGDHHLLQLGQFQGIQIISARDFLHQLS